MGTSKEQSLLFVILYLLLGCCCIHGSSVEGDDSALMAYLTVHTSSGRQIPDTLFGVFFEEINHAGAGGLWAELVSNRGFEGGSDVAPSNIDPWSIIGNDTTLLVGTERSSCFENNKMALKMDVLCGEESNISCPTGGVGIYNPGFWGMNIVQGQSYKVVFYVRSLGSINLTVSFTNPSSLQTLASANFVAAAADVYKWTKVELTMESAGTSDQARLQLTTSQKGVIWLDQVSAMPLDTFKGHGFRKDLFEMVAALKPQFIRFPGGCYVEGQSLRNAFRWKESIGPWEKRHGHLGDVWGYWTDDGLGYYEFLQLAEDLGARPIWVFNIGISHTDRVSSSLISPFVQEALDGIEFAIGDPSSTWGSVRAAMGHPEPFDLQYVGIGNENCGMSTYQENYLKFYYAIKAAYPNMKIISNCDLTRGALNHPADYFEYHVYVQSSEMFQRLHLFDSVTRNGPKGFVSEYAVHGQESEAGTLLAALGEAAFLIGIEKNSDLVEMASYAPLFVNTNDRRWFPDAIVFNSSQAFGIPSYWMQQFFMDSSGATLLNSTLKTISTTLTASVITWNASGEPHLKIKVVNYASTQVTLKLTIEGAGKNFHLLSGNVTVLKSSSPYDGNSFQQPTKVVPVSKALSSVGKTMDVVLAPYSLTAVDLLTDSMPITLSKIEPITKSESQEISVI